MVLVHMEKVSFNCSLSFDIRVEIQGHVVSGMMILKVVGEELDRNVNI